VVLLVLALTTGTSLQFAVIESSDRDNVATLGDSTRQNSVSPHRGKNLRVLSF